MKKIFTLVAALFSFCANAQWDTLNTLTNTNFNSIAFSDNYNGVAVGEHPTTGRAAVFFTVNAGQTWVAANMTTNSPAINDVGIFPPSSYGYAVGDSGQIYFCNTNVMTISAPFQIGTQNLNCVFPLNDSMTFIGGDNGALYRTSDFGTSWDTLSSQSTQPIRDIYFMNPLVGWLVGDGGYIAMTIDAGVTWTAQTQPYLGFFQCKSISFAGTSPNGFVVGNGGKMIESIDAGLTWDTVTPLTSKNLTCVRFGNNLAGIICGDSGNIYRTYVGGTNWANESMSYVKEKLNKICFSSDSVAFICGNDGRILRSNINISSVPTVSFAVNAQAYPNPFEAELNVMLNLEKTSAVQISIIDLQGRVVLQENFGELHAGANLISPDGINILTSGMYVMQVITSDGNVSFPLVRK